MPKHVFFDLDKTLTVSRTPLSPAYQELFDKLCAKMDVVVVTGGSAEQIREQITPRFDGHYHLLAQSGNHCIDKSGRELWREALGEEQVRAIQSFIELLRNEDFKGNPMEEENRGAQITASVIGFHADTEKKYAFDPDEKKRRAALANHPEEVAELLRKGVAVEPAGTTSFNFILAGKHKGFNITRFIKTLGWKEKDCLYVGDALFAGGNDESVIGVIPTRAVKDPDDTFDFIARELLS